MCLEINKRTSWGLKKKAEDPIKVYKIPFIGDNRSPLYTISLIYHFKYERDIPSPHISLVLKRRTTHKALGRNILLQYIKSFLLEHKKRKYTICIEEGYHSYSKDRMLYILKRLNLFDSIIDEFEIPKGAEYYEDEFGAIVSSDIIFRKKLAIKVNGASYMKKDITNYKTIEDFCEELKDDNSAEIKDSSPN